MTDEARIEQLDTTPIARVEHILTRPAGIPGGRGPHYG